AAYGNPPSVGLPLATTTSLPLPFASQRRMNDDGPETWSCATTMGCEALLTWTKFSNKRLELLLKPLTMLFSVPLFPWPTKIALPVAYEPEKATCPKSLIDGVLPSDVIARGSLLAIWPVWATTS